jgi:integrase
MFDYCRERPELTWLSWVIATLAYTGMRISEVSSLRESDIDFERNVIRLTNER